jgi:hypothetical protein
MSAANSRSGSARVSVLAIADSAARFCRAGAPPATRGVSIQNQCPACDALVLQRILNHER